MSLAEFAHAGGPRHLKVTGLVPAFRYEPCEDAGCLVPADGVASSCGRPACPSCGCSGTNLATLAALGAESGRRFVCTCGHSWQHGPSRRYVVTSAETAECTCPDDCECDHAND